MDRTGEETSGEGVNGVLTVPNAITFGRLLCIPLFLWLLFARDDRASSAWLLAALGSTDWVDGWVARRFNQSSDFGAAFDPIVDRLLFVVAIPCLIVDGSIPLAVAVAFLAREVLTGLLAIVAGVLGLPRIIITWEGKTGTFLMMFALPMFLGAASTLSYAPLLAWLAWLFAVPGLVYAWYSALFQYVPAVWRTARRDGAAPAPPDGTV